jgi:threonine synthase
MPSDTASSIQATRLLDDAMVRSALDWPTVIDTVRRAYRVAASGGVLPSSAAHVPFQAGSLHVKAGGTVEPSSVSVKANLRRDGSPASGVILLFNPKSGTLRAVLDSAEITAYRTAATAIVAARALGAKDGCSVAILGVGPVGAGVLHGMRSEFEVDEFHLWSRDADRAAALAAAAGSGDAIPIRVHATPGAAAAQADVVITCTPSQRPLIGAADLRDGALVLAMGADSPGKRELAADVLDGAVIFSDNAAGALSVGESAYLPESSRSAVVGELGELLTGEIATSAYAGRRLVFDAVGVAHVDAAVATAVVQQAEGAGSGTFFAFSRSQPAGPRPDSLDTSVETTRPTETSAEPCYLDTRSGLSYPVDVRRWRGDDGAPLLLSPGRGLTPKDIDTHERSLWRYRAALPTDIVRPISLGEGCTPLLERSWGATRVLFKPEWFGPTGSFKDRGTSVLISALVQHGVDEVVEDSSGNAGASISAYCAAAGIRARILVPEDASPAKILQSRAHGAEVQLVPGGRDAVAAEALRQSRHTVYAGHNWQPFFVEGIKTLAYEIWEGLGFRAPDNVVTVAGAGIIVLGCDLGFSELLANGQIERLPRLLVAQPANCAPIHAAFQSKSTGSSDHGFVHGDWTPTIAEGAAIAEPTRLPEVLAAIRRSGGDMAAIPEEDIVSAARRLAAMGLYTEPTSATGAAALDVFVQRGMIQPGDTTVVVLTGTGLKTPEAFKVAERAFRHKSSAVSA